MRFIILATIIFLASAFAGERQNPKTVTITFTVPEVEMVLKGLDELPHKESAPLYQKVIMQANQQLAPQPEKKVADSSKPKKQ